ncbi:unnamed protein product [Bursaphelenchus okinawaensis]|uniref:DUF3677 domain-containing protein n=1 Tax=Bursaphelenchus okinawaensis TaxID=465554 RepID=A0A811LJB7_9BILA|nr:unnamed protein product [Bursaphelenchus okinawaensis]CAG9124253.1 unnamed protein product [Bursaphelenchus okinawaensis]
MLPNRKNLAKKPGPVAGTSTAASRLAAQKRTGALLPGTSAITKKQRMDMAKAGSSALGGGMSSSTSLVKLVEVDSSWMECVKDFTLVAKDFGTLMKMAKEKGKGRTVKVICGAIKSIIKADEANAADLGLLKELHQALLDDESIYNNPNIYGAVFTLLNKVETQASQNGISFLPIAINILKSFEAVPVSVFNFVLVDSMGLRLWVDKQDALNLVLDAFSIVGRTELPSEGLSEVLSDAQSYSFKNLIRESMKFEESNDQNQALLKSTLAHLERSIDSGASKNLLKTLCLCCGNDKFRLLAAKKLDNWLMNIKTQRQALELLLFVAVNTKDANSDANLEVLGYLTRVKLQKSKQLQTVFQTAIKEILNKCPSGLRVLAEFVLENEFTHSNKAQTNLGFVQFLFAHDSKGVLRLLSEKLVRRLEVVEQVKNVRTFIRDLFRSIKDFPYSSLAKEMIDAAKLYVNAPPPNQNHIFRLIIDICTMLPFVSASAAVKEAAQTRRSNGNLAGYQTEVLNKFQLHLQRTQLELLTFINWAATNFTMDSTNIINAVGGALYLKMHQFYTTNEAWPSEPDFNHIMKLISECVVEETLILAIIDLNGAIQPAEAISMLENVTKRALTMRIDMETDKIMDIRSEKCIMELFNLAIVDQSTSPKLASKQMYWKCWEIVFLWACMSPALIAECYDRYTTLRMLITMAVTRDFTFPLPILDKKFKEQLIAEDQAELEKEWEVIKQQDLSQDDENSNSGSPPSSAYSLFKPNGIARAPPESTLKNLYKLNKDHDFGTQLTALKQLDLLEKLIQEQGPLRVMPSLVNMLNQKPEFVEKIPLIALAQLYLIVVFDQKMNKSIDELSPNLVGAKPFGADLQTTITNKVTECLKNVKSSVEDCKVILLALINKLSASLILERDLASIGLNLVFNPEIADQRDFNPDSLKNCAHFEALKEDLCFELALACSLEKKNERIMCYMEFIVNNIGESTLHRAAPRLSSLVERSNSNSDEHQSIQRSLINFFADLIKKLRVSSKKGDEDALVVTLANMDIIRLDPTIVSAILELLCESSVDNSESQVVESRQYLMDVFFPAKGHLTVTDAKNRSVDLISHKLRMKMLSAKDERIVVVALTNINPKDALKYVQSFALTPFSCTELLKSINTSDVAKSEEAKMAIPFVKAYKVKGAKGADEFLKQVESLSLNTQSEVKMEVDLNETPVLFQKIEGPTPVCSPAKPRSPLHQHKADIKTKEDLKRYWNSIIINQQAKSPSYISDSNWISAMKLLKRPDMAKETIIFVKNSIDRFMASYKHLLYSMVSTCIVTVKQYSRSLWNDINSLEAVISRKYPDNQVLKALFASIKRRNDKKEMVKEEVDVSKLDSFAILKKLANPQGEDELNDLTITAMVERYMILNPQVIDHQKPEEMKKHLNLLFSSDSVACKHLIALITTTRTPQVTIAILKALLHEFNPNLKPLNVMDFVENALKSTSRICLGLNDDDLLTLLQYVFLEVGKTENDTVTSSQAATDDVIVVEERLAREVKDVDMRDIEEGQVISDDHNNSRSSSYMDFGTDSSVTLSQPLGTESSPSRGKSLLNPSSIIGPVAIHIPGIEALDDVAHRLHHILIDAVVEDEENKHIDRILRKISSRITAKIEEINVNSDNRSAILKKKYERFQKLFTQKFPQSKAAKLKKNRSHNEYNDGYGGVTLDWTNDYTVESLDQKLQWNLKEFFELNASTISGPTKDQMLRPTREQIFELAHKYPEVFARHLPILIHQVQLINNLTPRQFREVDRFPVLRGIMDLVMVSAPYSFEKTEEIHMMVASYLKALTKETAKSRQWMLCTESLIRLILNFLEANPTGATNLVERNKPDFDTLIEAYRDNQAIRAFQDAFPLIFNV